MKLVTFVKSGEERLGLLAGDVVVDPLLASATGDVREARLSFIKSGAAGMSAAPRDPRAIRRSRPALALKDVTLAAPIRPATILCSGSNYKDHNAEKANTPISGKEPEFFVKTADCVVGPDEPIAFDERFSKKIDCEVELAIVIGKAGRFIETARALEHVFGYTIVNDVTARDRQVRRTPEGMTWYELGSGKAFDSGAPLGPCIVTADEIADPQKLKVMSRINGELRQSSSTANMIWSCAELIHFFSRNFTLKPGMVIITGTPSGTAWSVDKELGGKGMHQPGLVPGDALLPAGRRGRMRGRGHRRPAQSGRRGEAATRAASPPNEERAGRTDRPDGNISGRIADGSPQISARRAAAAPMAGALALARAGASAGPTRNITMIVAFPPGGQADLAARPVALALEKILGKSVVVDNRSGAGGMLGNAAAARAEPDGHTLLMALSSMTFLPEAERLYDRKPSYEMDQLVPIARVLADPGVLGVRSRLALEVGRRSRRRRQEAAGPDLVQLVRQLRRVARAVRDVPAGRRHQAPARAVSRRRAGADRVPRQAGRHHRAGAGRRSTPHVQSGKARLLANWGAKRAAGAPGIPTMIELGYKDVEYYIWAGLFAPKGTPAPVIARLRDAMRQVMRDPAVTSVFVKAGSPPAYMDQPEFAKFVEADAKRLIPVVKKIGRLDEKK